METFTIGNSILVNIGFTLWTGRVKLDMTEVPQAANLMPPKELYNSGSIKIFDTDKLKVFRNFKTRADLCASALGLRVKGFEGWLVDENNISQLEGELSRIRADWDNALDDFVSHYLYAARDWANSCGKWDRLIAQKQPTEFEIRSRFNFGWWTARITPETTHAGEGNMTSDLIQGIPDQALQSIVDSLKALYDDSFNKGNDPSSKAYNALGRIAQRAQALGFANPNVARLAPVLQDLVVKKNHVLARLVLSRMDNPQSVLDVLSISDGQGIDSLVVTPPADAQELALPTYDVMDAAVRQSVPAGKLDSLMEEAKRMLRPVNALADEFDRQREANGVAPDVLSETEIATQRARFDDGLITLAEYNDWLNHKYKAGLITMATLTRWALSVTTPNPAPQPMSSSDVLDSLGLF